MKIFEYAHGKTKPSKTIDTTGYSPYGCAANLQGGVQTGYFAYVNLPDAHYASGSVTIVGGRRPGVFGMRPFSSVGYICYDKHSDTANLWIDGISKSGGFLMSSFGPHQVRFEPVQFPAPITSPGDVWWDGRALDVADQAGSNGTTVYRFRLARHEIKLVDTVSLSEQVAQYTTSGSTLVGSVATEGTVDFWDYTAGGQPTQIITGLTNPFGVAISPVLQK